MAVTVSSSPAIWPELRNQDVGPFEDGNGNLYIFVVDITNKNLEAYKSDDGGATWAEQDSGGTNQPSWSHGAAAQVAVSCALSSDGDHVRVARNDTGTVSDLVPVVTEFAMSSAASGADTWTSAGIGTPGSYTSGDVFHIASSNGVMFLVVNGDDDMVLFHQAPHEMVMGSFMRRMNIQRWLGASWAFSNWHTDTGADQDGVDAHFDFRAALVGDGRIHFFYTRSDDGTIQHRSYVPSTGSFGSAEALTGATDLYQVSDTYAIGLPVLSGGTEIVLPYRRTSDARLAVLRATSAATLTDEATTGVGGNTQDALTANGAVADASGEIHAFWGDSSFFDLYRDEDGGSDTWDTDVELEDAVTVRGVSARYCPTNGLVGVAFYDTGAAEVKFTSVAVAGPAGSLPAPHPLARTRVFSR